MVFPSDYVPEMIVLFLLVEVRTHAFDAVPPEFFPFPSLLPRCRPFLVILHSSPLSTFHVCLTFSPGFTLLFPLEASYGLMLSKGGPCQGFFSSFCGWTLIFYFPNLSPPSETFSPWFIDGGFHLRFLIPSKSSISASPSFRRFFRTFCFFLPCPFFSSYEFH